MTDQSSADPATASSPRIDGATKERDSSVAVVPTERSWRSSWTRGTVSTVGLILVVSFSAARVLAVDVGGIVTNDSVGYLRRAEAPLGGGFVFQGYRQVGYPVFIWMSNRLGDGLGWDHIFGVALLQRSLLVFGLGLVVWALRWWSLPILVFATSSTFVLQTDFVLTEGLLIPGCLIGGALLAAVVVNRVVTRRPAHLVVLSSVAVGVACAFVKMQYASLLALTVAIAWLLVRDGLCTRRFVLYAVGVGVVLITSLALVQAVDNRSDLGTFEPIAERHRSKWWGAWQAVFVLKPENRDDPALAEFYDEGNLYTFLHGIERDVPDYNERRELTEKRVKEMFAAADTSAAEEQVASFLGALRGGRSDDLRAMTEQILAAEDGDPISRVTRNAAFQIGGPEAIIEDLNGGLRPGIVTTGPMFDFTQRGFANYRSWSSEMSVLSMVAMSASFIVRGRHRPACAAVMMAMFAVSAAMATGYADNARYLLGPLVIVLIGGVLATRALVFSPMVLDVASRTAGGIASRGRNGSEAFRADRRPHSRSRMGPRDHDEESEPTDATNNALERALETEQHLSKTGGHQTPRSKSAGQRIGE